ncbi:Oxysterol-binding protein [Aphelenchoides avenae]|nr:Oxysterol-binding protein [Aphelenchus avenae]
MTRRRHVIPERPSNSINYLSVMKNCIGKDLSKVAMPVDFNEPLSALQRATEDLEYANLLDRAAAEDDPLRRMAYVAAFAVSAYSTTAHRTTKPFNPLLGETYECDRRADLGWRSFAEQVSHHPPTSALWAEGRKWQLQQCYTFTSKVKGRSICVTPVGSTYVYLPQTDDLFVYGKVSTSTSMTNIVSGKLHTHNHGELEILNWRTGVKAVLKFHENGYFSKDEDRKVTGTIRDGEGRVEFLLDALWDRYAKLHVGPDIQPKFGETLWTAHPLPAGAEKTHNFTKFAITLNEQEPDVAPTDSRLRPDQRLMEEGEWPAANLVKRKLEDAQRTRRRLREQDGTDYQPLWFRPKTEEEMMDKNDCYEFTGDYWKQKATADWSLCPNIFKFD